MPPPPLFSTHDRRFDAEALHGQQPVHVVVEGEVAQHDEGSARPRPQRRRDRRRRCRRSRSRPGYRGSGPASAAAGKKVSRSRTGMLDETNTVSPGASSDCELAMHARLEQLVTEQIEEGVDRLVRERGGPAPVVQPGAFRSRARARPRPRWQSIAGSARTISAAICVGSFQAPSGSITTWRGAGLATSHWRTAFEVTMSPTRSTSSGAGARAARAGSRRRPRRRDLARALPPVAARSARRAPGSRLSARARTAAARAPGRAGARRGRRRAGSARSRSRARRPHRRPAPALAGARS